MATRRAELERADAAEPRLRRATRSDVPLVAQLERSCFSDPWSEDSFAGLIGDDRVLFAVLDGERGRIAGYVIAWFVLDEGEIANLAVAPDVRGRRLGAALLDAAIDEARRRGMRTMYLEVRESNVAARRLYASRGFAELGRRRNYYARPVEDALVLRLTL